MRLAKIKLAGFKSFVDPTHLALPSNLVGVVGPNGCGKSNVIDAVRWVMGESSAKHLRGDSMADVIFNGSTSRKPVGQASIELVFDNSDGSMGGQYAQFNEVAVRRQIARDGQSVYYLNGARCRRKDITDVFLGTGLGPRSYAIIEQGMISRVIEARPEELRGFIEEAAGISKYKERRRETENRMRHTRENLERLNDVRDELDKQLQRLQRQARTAERYKELKAEERAAKAQLTALRWRALDGRRGDEERRLRELETAHEAHMARLRELEAAIERTRETQVAATDRFNEVQSRYYAVGADVARIEQAIQHSRERQEQLRRDRQRLEQSLKEATGHLESDERQLAEVTQALTAEEPQLAAAQAEEARVRGTLVDTEKAMQDWQARWDDLNNRAAAPARAAEVEQARIQDLERGLGRIHDKLRRLEEEQAGLDSAALEKEVAALEEDSRKAEAQVAALEEQLAGHQGRIRELREHNGQVADRLHTARGRVQDLRGRQSSLETLQEQALGKGSGALAQWLAARGLGEARRLAEALEVEPGWERAVETVLGHHLEAACSDGDLNALAGATADFDGGVLAVFDTAAAGEPRAADPDTLAARVRAPWSLAGLLAGVRAAPDLDEALAQRPFLGPGESLITPDGVWLGRSWLRLDRDDGGGAGVLAREQALRQLASELEAARAEAAALEEEQARLRDAQREAEQAQSRTQEELRGGRREAGELQNRTSSRRARLEQVQGRARAVAAEHEELVRQRGGDEAAVAEARGRLEQALEQSAAHARERDALSGERKGLEASLGEARQAWQHQREAVQQQALRLEGLRTRRDALNTGLERARGRTRELETRLEEQVLALDESEGPLAEAQADLKTKLDLRVAVEAELRQARDAVSAADTTLRETMAERHQAEQAAEAGRGELESARVSHRDTEVRLQTLREQLESEGAALEPVLADLPADAAEGPWAERVAELEQRIGRLGPINLAAIDEYEQESERKTYLDEQHRDLSEALETLEGAMRKIDRETRTRFKETFERVDSGLKELFPLLFGGGHAYLELTSDDLLETGVTVMARPPGKRNSTIHLLSGGEKALTAVALVFAIFQLNPAPFCLLDEVDAPLDDANVGRFCDLVRSLSDRVQFLFITHNKITMELSDHLVGVTMREAGVSRLVAVDVDAAVEMAAS